VSGTATPGAGLLPARPARPIRPGERIHVVGAAGAGASAAVLHAAWAGAAVDGCDPGGPSSYTAPFASLGIPIAPGHAAEHVTRTPPPDRLAVTKALTAIAPDHPELVAARRAGIPIEPWQQVIADAASGRRLIGVAGTHGKSTTAGWLVHVLVEAGMDPSAFVGALLPPSLTGGIGPATARRGSGEAFVVEADEYAGNFDAYRPDIVLVTTIEWDHPDVFADIGDVIEAFETWLRAVPDATLVANLGDHGVDALVRRLADRPGPIVGVQLENRDGPTRPSEMGATPRPAPGSRIDRSLSGAAWVERPDRTNLRLFDHGTAEDLGVSALQVAGFHNAANAAVVAGGALALGVSPEAIVTGLASFGGVGRRLERLGEAAGVVVFDDYGHHPSAIRVTLEAVRQRVPGRRVWAVYEPLTYHRTAAMLDQFAEVLAEADAVAIADNWAGRDPDTTITSSDALAQAIAKRRPGLVAEAPGSVRATADWLAHEVRPGDAVLVMGGGKSTEIGRLLLEALADR
jgi:UDP-N-acetylmuramate--alanine ligase